MRYIVGALVLFSLLVSCSQQKEIPKKKIKIATNLWIGYMPLFCAYEKGELEKLGFSLIINVSLAEAADVYSVGKADMVTTTQHEYHVLKKLTGDIVPVVLLDRSNGGDMILSNASLDTIKKASSINVYLEVDSINVELLGEFLKKYAINRDKLHVVNMDQQKIQDVKNGATPTLIVTYVPYDSVLKKRGFKEIASTRDIHDLVVIDALCARKKVVRDEKERLVALKKLIDKNIEMIQKDPKRSYNYVQKYFGDMSYEEYLESLNKIEWINNPSSEILKIIETMGYHKEEFVQ